MRSEPTALRIIELETKTGNAQSCLSTDNYERKGMARELMPEVPSLPPFPPPGPQASLASSAFCLDCPFPPSSTSVDQKAEACPTPPRSFSADPGSFLAQRVSGHLDVSSNVSDGPMVELNGHTRLGFSLSFRHF
jgi:hypothetical protein